MTWRDKLELGLKEDAPYRKDNLPEFQIRGPEIPNGPGRSPTIPEARHDAQEQGRHTTKPDEARAARTPATRKPAARKKRQR